MLECKNIGCLGIILNFVQCFPHAEENVYEKENLAICTLIAFTLSGKMLLREGG